MNKNYALYHIGMVILMLLHGSCLSAMDYQRLDDREQNGNSEIQFLEAVERCDIDTVRNMLADCFFPIETLKIAFDIIISGNCEQAAGGNGEMLSVVSDAIIDFDPSREWQQKPKRARKQTKKVAFTAPKPKHPSTTPMAWLLAMGTPIALVNMNGK